jgi:mRNA-degrading endonuclease YafQ of YafQ-DinJ toxin-antitoxin module
MSYFIFLKDSDNVEGTLYRIAENQSDLNNLNISQNIYKIIEDSQSNFNLVKFGNKNVTKYSNNVITYVDQENLFRSKEQLKNHIDNLKNQIKQFTDNNPNHPLFSRWNNYYNQLNTLNLDSITYPLNKSLEQYFNDLGQPSYNILQLA